MENRPRAKAYRWLRRSRQTQMGSLARLMIAGSSHAPVTRVCALAVGAAMAYAAGSYESDLNVRRPPVLTVRASRTSRGRGQGSAARVVWVMVDGLRLDASREMTVLNR